MKKAKTLYILLCMCTTMGVFSQGFLSKKGKPKEKIKIKVEGNFYKTNFFALEHKGSSYGIEAIYFKRDKKLESVKIFHPDGRISIYLHNRRGGDIEIVETAHKAVKQSQKNLRLRK